MSNIINICHAFLLSIDYDFIQDVFPIVSKKDHQFLYVNHSHILRITFEKDLLQFNDITIYGYAEGTDVSIFYEGSSNLIARVLNIKEYKKYQVILNEITGNQETFDLKFSGEMYIDFIVDPVVISDGLIGYWPLNETHGSVAYDYSHYDRMSPFNGNVIPNQEGLFDRSCSFSGIPICGVEVGNIDSIILSHNSLTFQAWINPDIIGMNGIEAIISNTVDNYAFLEYRMTPNRGFLCGMFTTDTSVDWQYEFCQGTLNTGEWQMITCSWNGTHQLGYYNGQQCPNIYKKGGVLKRQNNIGHPLFIGSRPIHTGGYPNSYKGRINEVAIWNRSLLSNEINSLYNNGKGRRIFSPDESFSIIAQKDLQYLNCITLLNLILCLIISIE